MTVTAEVEAAQTRAIDSLARKVEELAGREAVALALLKALEGMVEAYWRGSEDSSDEEAPSCVTAALTAIEQAKKVVGHG